MWLTVCISAGKCRFVWQTRSEGKTMQWLRKALSHNWCVDSVTQSTLSQWGFIFAMGLWSNHGECSKAEKSEGILLCWSLHMTHRVPQRKTMRRCSCIFNEALKKKKICKSWLVGFLLAKVQNWSREVWKTSQMWCLFSESVLPCTFLKEHCSPGLAEEAYGFGKCYSMIHSPVSGIFRLDQLHGHGEIGCQKR